jgi:NhaB family Na+:H+ antiporter
VLIGMTSANQIKHELVANIEVLLLVFMVAGIYFMKQLLLYVFTKMLVRIHSKRCFSRLLPGLPSSPRSLMP